jgi:hypothetical protein
VYESPKLFRTATWKKPDRCWPTDESGKRTRFFADVPAAWPKEGDDTSKRNGRWLCPPAPCGKPVVPIALIYKTKPDEKLAVREEGKTFLPGPFYPHALTHIVGVNWTHGGDAPADIRKDYSLRVWFDRPIRPATVEKTDSWNARTFRVSFATFNHPEKFRPAIPKKVGLEGDGRVAVFEFDRDSHCNHGLFKHTQDVLIRVELACDFILDVNERAVDGNHIAGAVPSMTKEPELYEKWGEPKAGYRTGDGVEGGTFESWFILPPECGKPHPHPEPGDTETPDDSEEADE